MWIRSQDEFRLVNVEELVITKQERNCKKEHLVIKVGQNENAFKIAAKLSQQGYKVVETYGGGDNPRVVYEKPEFDYWINDLGKYDTKERALEVLQDIEEAIALDERVFDMPRE